MESSFQRSGIDDGGRIEHEERRGIRRSIAEVQWLLVILVVLYYKLPETRVDNELFLLSALCLFSFFVLVTHYLLPRQKQSQWSIVLDTWSMIGFITVVLWVTGRIESQLLSLYYLVVIIAASTLRRSAALLNVGLITACFLLLSHYTYQFEDLTAARLSGPLIQLFPLWLVAYLGAVLARETGRARYKIQRLSQTDYLTGLWNMRSFISMADSEQERALRYDRSFAVLMLDADNLKPVNDTYGHEAGSELITHVATVIREQLRSSDIIARFGGDEFVALLPETVSESACIAAERIRGILAEYAMDFKNASITVTVSIGVAGFSEHGGSVKEVMNCADKALYFCKESGRNKIAVFDPACMHGSNAANA